LQLGRLEARLDSLKLETEDKFSSGEVSLQETLGKSHPPAKKTDVTKINWFNGC
jgi:hypothetical protein